MEEEIKITIPKPLYDSITGRIEDTEFSSVDEYIIFVLKEIISEEEEKPALTEEEEEKVKEKLRGLGYL